MTSPGTRADRPVTGPGIRAEPPPSHAPQARGGRAIGFHRRPPFPFLQVAWPDAGGGFHWEERAAPAHRSSQPSLWLPPGEHPPGVWPAGL
ncbi:hypothetical protein [Streptomyces sp. NPDC101145]|uniref:hypothetical protein n=1 Tax=Streptomyces sp. NPDC101145 TaxID=3366112 RepID=UPI0037F384AC